MTPLHGGEHGRRRRRSAAVGLVVLWLLPSCADPPTAPTSRAQSFLSGAYQLRLESTCTGIPSNRRVRTYYAVSDGPIVTLSGATFWQHPSEGVRNRFTAARAGLTLNFELGGNNSFGIVERFDDGTYLEIAGSGTGKTDEPLQPPTGERVPVTGTIVSRTRYGADVRDGSQHLSCEADQINLVLTPFEGAVPAPGVDASIRSAAIAGPNEVPLGGEASFAAEATLVGGAKTTVTPAWRMPTTRPSSRSPTPASRAAAASAKRS